MSVYFIDEEINGTCFLYVDEQAILIDPGMAYMGHAVVERVKNILGDQKLDAIFLTHSHYDHVAAVPYVKSAWPEAPVYAAEYAANVFSKPAAIKMMMGMSETAAVTNRSDWRASDEDYDSSLIHADVILHDGDITMVGDTKVQTVATVGHTKCSVSFFVNDKILFSSETIGLEGLHNTGYLPAFLISYSSTVDSLNRTRALNPEDMYMPHRGLISHPDDALWDHLESGLAHTKDVIIEILASKDSFDDQIVAMEEEFWAKTSKESWPKDAFDINAAAMLKTIAKEFPEEIKAAKAE